MVFKLRKEALGETWESGVDTGFGTKKTWTGTSPVHILLAI